MKNKLLMSGILSASLLSGCATIVGENTQLIPISSTPTDATIVITDEAGTQFFKGLTPTTVTLPKSTGRYFGKKSFSVQISKEGYNTQIIPITASANGWYIAGNFFFGGLIGWFIIDPLNGSMYTLSPDKISPNLGENLSHNNTGEDGTISIVLLQDVPHHLLSEMEKLN